MDDTDYGNIGVHVSTNGTNIQTDAEVVTINGRRIQLKTPCNTECIGLWILPLLVIMLFWFLCSNDLIGYSPYYYIVAIPCTYYYLYMFKNNA